MYMYTKYMYMYMCIWYFTFITVLFYFIIIIGKRSPLPKRVHHVNPNSPFQGVVPADDTASENRSPTKSPSQQQQQSLGQILALNNNKGSSNFNPNAPSFVPMGMPQVKHILRDLYKIFLSKG